MASNNFSLEDSDNVFLDLENICERSLDEDAWKKVDELLGVDDSAKIISRDVRKPIEDDFTKRLKRNLEMDRKSDFRVFPKEKKIRKYFETPEKAEFKLNVQPANRSTPVSKLAFDLDSEFGTPKQDDSTKKRLKINLEKDRKSEIRVFPKEREVRKFFETPQKTESKIDSESAEKPFIINLVTDSEEESDA